VINFNERCTDDLWDFKVRHCFLCRAVMSKEVIMKVHPLITGVGVLCIDGGDVRSVLFLGLMKRIQDRISLPISFQKFFKVACGISSG
jgi:hypothetical protein